MYYVCSIERASSCAQMVYSGGSHRTPSLVELSSSGERKRKVERGGEERTKEREVEVMIFGVTIRIRRASSVAQFQWRLRGSSSRRETIRFKRASSAAQLWRALLVLVVEAGVVVVVVVVVVAVVVVLVVVVVVEIVVVVRAVSVMFAAIQICVRDGPVSSLSCTS